MLVLTRGCNQSIRAGNITITVVRIGGGKVRLGIDAPAEVPVVRGELSPRPAPEPTEPSHADSDDGQGKKRAA